MSNPATKAPNFTVENAVELGRKGGLARKASYQREREILAQARKQLAESPKPFTDEARKNVTLSQIDAIDARIINALDDDDEERFLKLTAAKERLWKLVQPTAGVSKPGRNRRDQPSSQPIEAPAAEPSKPA
jgi:hypothetical protein